MEWMTSPYASAALDNARPLRQGDIIREVHIFGALKASSIQYTSSANGEEVSWAYAQKPTRGDAMIISHSCEIDPSNNDKLTSLILAPLRSVSSATKPETMQRLIESNYIDENSPVSFLKYFYLESNQLLQQKDGAVVDFSKCFSLHKSAYQSLLDRRILSLIDEAADMMARKLALYFFRSQQPSTAMAA